MCENDLKVFIASSKLKEFMSDLCVLNVKNITIFDTDREFNACSNSVNESLISYSGSKNLTIKMLLNRSIDKYCRLIKIKTSDEELNDMMRVSAGCTRLAEFYISQIFVPTRISWRKYASSTEKCARKVKIVSPLLLLLEYSTGINDEAKKKWKKSFTLFKIAIASDLSSFT